MALKIPIRKNDATPRTSQSRRVLLSLGQFGAGQAIQADTRLRRLYCQAAMNFRGNAYQKSAAELPRGERFRNRFAVDAHVFDDACHRRTDSAKRRFGRGRQPAQAGKLGAKADILVVLFRPSSLDTYNGHS